MCRVKATRYSHGRAVVPHRESVEAALIPPCDRRWLSFRARSWESQRTTPTGNTDSLRRSHEALRLAARDLRSSWDRQAPRRSRLCSSVILIHHRRQTGKAASLGGISRTGMARCVEAWSRSSNIDRIPRSRRSRNSVSPSPQAGIDGRIGAPEGQGGGGDCSACPKQGQEALP
ncbi:unnamed protein product [Lota lota]